MKEQKFKMKIKVEGCKIIDSEFNDFESMEDSFKEIKRKLK